MLRLILGVVVGIIVGGVFNMALIMLSWSIYPMSEGTNMADPASFSAYIKTLPVPAFLIILAAHAGGALIGGLAGAVIAGKSQRLVGVIVGTFFLLGGIYNAFAIPAPIWFLVIDLISYIPCGILGASMVGKSSPSRNA